MVVVSLPTATALKILSTGRLRVSYVNCQWENWYWEVPQMPSYITRPERLRRNRQAECMLWPRTTRTHGGDVHLVTERQEQIPGKLKAETIGNEHNKSDQRQSGDGYTMLKMIKVLQKLM